ncbi:biopolymer transporter ExbD [Desulfuromonas acetoxidans]|uniref:Biopolymer transport protein ExbD/TolR n=1 Tax=Desulfuromonas acetoxidans (strain DSM 684 / 11070) TaxID=281689 RepID=Q1K0M9_DESA6|nr:biopolymer transporter ExbD [Desulfuromonas acetoxidans]EAT15912.1 Biopolymer transport protein ExbD/TolR [Desulfuromonas acetoxidans DSM 684]MBF0644190.1 biopolymer transporter ExbD [Desulfuromonas acetoxidans]NVD24512.1 biopolymer transporter ExbD [Desulfuromonas acetoxidans]NVE16538.1 biopolymer transporter ExbD [Desulfuromonas acetoxidans]
MAFKRKERDEVRVELTSMVDVVFLLLIFFMISTTFVDSTGIDINLPQAGSQKIDKQPEEVNVYLEKSGLIHLEDRLVSMEDLRSHLAGYGDRAAETTFILLADKQAQHGKVVQLMDAAQSAGFAKLAIATEPEIKKR